MLFTNPITLNDGTSDHVFKFRGTLPDRKAMVGEWIEPAAASSDESKIVVKQDSSSATVRRSLLQRKVNKATTTRGDRPVTWNVTCTRDVEHSDADVKAELALLIDALSEADFGDNFLDGFV